ncbi:MAG: response regulator [Deltaproteobacteria bacterium]|nr:response regulator [Deltaproteobacteria bacterium]MBW1993807.1 response regulator [Deltaproteobacteria bacterium]MBW2154466.1 response regulator [Deltaproteobacteria bacterium]
MSRKSLIVLLVEDDPDHTELIIRSFQNTRFTHRIKHVADGALALDYLFRKGEYADAAKSPRPNLILLDLRIPKVDGMEVLKKIKGTDKLLRIPVVILTSSTIQKEIDAAYDNHANSYLVKPVDFDKFTKLIRGLRCYWLEWNHNPNL